MFSACTSINVSLLTPMGAVAGSLGTSGTGAGSGGFSVRVQKVSLNFTTNAK